MRFHTEHEKKKQARQTYICTVFVLLSVFTMSVMICIEILLLVYLWTKIRQKYTIDAIKRPNFYVFCIHTHRNFTAFCFWVLSFYCMHFLREIVHCPLDQFRYTMLSQNQIGTRAAMTSYSTKCSYVCASISLYCSIKCTKAVFF